VKEAKLTDQAKDDLLILHGHRDIKRIMKGKELP
jgi:hypothetical protein